MNFKVKKIKNNRKKGFWGLLAKVFGKKGSLILSIIPIVGICFWGFFSFISSPKIKKTTSNIFSVLEKDEEGHINIVLLGVAGSDREGGNLSDSILIASINPKVPSVSFLSFPRDLFIDSSIGSHKVNEIFARARSKAIAPYVEEGVKSINELDDKTLEKADIEGISAIKKALSDFTGIDIHYGVVINFSAFEELVDTLGGVDIFVREDIQDPFYPDINYGYQTFTIRRGLQHLDGKTALKYARSRKTSSDYNRAQRQQDLLLALREKAANKDLLTDFTKLKEFYDVFKRNIKMDLGIRELIELAKIGVGIDYSNSVSAVLNDDPTQKGGFLYVPAKEFYGGQFVLLPKNKKETKNFIDLLLIHSGVLIEKAQIAVLNGSGIAGEARRLSTKLRRMGFHVIQIGNYNEGEVIEKSFIQNISEKDFSKTMNILTNFISIPKKDFDQQKEQINGENIVDLRIIIGKDMVKKDENI